MDILLASDTHIFAHKNSLQRLQDCLDVLTWIFETCRNRSIKHFVFLGDLLHDRQKIQTLAYCKTFQIFQQYQDINVVLLLGNHDLWYYEKTDVNSILPFGALPNVQIISEPCTVKVADLSIDFLPFTHNPIQALKAFPAKARILCGHVAVDDAQLNKVYNTKSEVSVEIEKDMVPVGSSVFDGWERVFLGHYHGAQLLGHVEYIGSPLQLNFNEAFQTKHIVVLDTETLVTEYIENVFSPKHLILSPENIHEHDLTNAFVQVQVPDVNSLAIVDLRKEILDTKNVQHLEFRERKTKEHKPEALQTKFDLANGDVLERYVATVGHGHLDYKTLLDMGKEICQTK